MHNEKHMKMLKYNLLRFIHEKKIEALCNTGPSSMHVAHYSRKVCRIYGNFLFILKDKCRAFNALSI